MKKRSLYLTVVILALIVGVIFFMRNFYTPDNVIRTAVKESELSGQNYILCKSVIVTGFDWVLIKNEDGKKTNELCNIVGPTPFKELKLDADFVWAQNTYIFYVVEKRMVYSEVTKQEEVEYLVAGWDILYPVKHGFPYFLSPKKYITEKDLR